MCPPSFPQHLARGSFSDDSDTTVEGLQSDSKPRSCLSGRMRETWWTVWSHGDKICQIDPLSSLNNLLENVNIPWKCKSILNGLGMIGRTVISVQPSILLKVYSLLLNLRSPFLLSYQYEVHISKFFEMRIRSIFGYCHVGSQRQRKREPVL